MLVKYLKNILKCVTEHERALVSLALFVHTCMHAWLVKSDEFYSISLTLLRTKMEMAK